MNQFNFIALCLISILAGSLLFAQETPQLGKDPVEDVIAAMTVEEKVGLVIGTGMRFPGLPQNMQGPAVGETEDKVAGAAGTTRAFAHLGIPSMVLADGPAGLRIQPIRNGDSTKSYYCTAFPIAQLLASTWDTELVEQVGRAVGEELKEYGVDILLAPALNIHRNPLGGRNFEYYSEDPLITGKIAAAMVRGVQSNGVGTSLKHFVANNHEWNRNVINVIANERALREIYLRGFEIAVKESKPWTIMTSYNKLNGRYTSENPDLLTKVVREDWKYGGFVMTDWFGGKDPVAQMVAGNDLLMPGTGAQYDTLVAAVQSGKLDGSILDRNLGRILNIILKSPAFKKYAFSEAPDLKTHASVARSAAAQGMVLLKNEGQALPLQAKASLAIFGNVSYEMITGGTGSGDVNEAYSIPLIDGLTAADFVVSSTLAETYKTYLSEEKAKQPRALMFRLPPPVPERPLSDEEIQAVSEETDMALITIGRRSGEFSDRKLEDDFYLSETEKANIQLISEAYHKNKKKVVVVLNIGGVIEMATWRDQVDAILLAWQPGQEAGYAIADVLSGVVNPCGKLATTFPVDYLDVPSSSNFPGTVLKGPDPNNRSFMRGDEAAEVEYTDDIWVGYRHFNTRNIETAYPFGYGLSYTTFKYSDMELSDKIFKDGLIVSVRITNTGKIAGKEAVQIYVSAPGKSMVKPETELKAFAKTKLLDPEESETMTFSITPMDLASFDPDKSSWIAEQGEYEIRVASSSRNIQGILPFSVSEEIVVEKVNRVLSPEREIAVIE